MAVTENLMKYKRLYQIAQQIDHDTSDFFTNNKGAGKGDRFVHAFMKQVRSQATHEFQNDYSEQCICGNNRFAVDFYFPDEETIVEIALTLKNSNSEFYKDIFKAALSQRIGKAVQRLVFISKPGAKKRHSEPASEEIKKLAGEVFKLSIEILEL